MTLAEQVLAQAIVMAGELDDRETAVLNVLCQVATSSLLARLREGITPDDCKADFVASASLFALAALSGVDAEAQVNQLTVGDVTVKRQDCDAASKCLRNQAELIISPYLRSSFTFTGV